jgi:anti-anti-sigma factor
MVTFNRNTDEKVITATLTGRLDTLAVQTLNELIQANLPSKEDASGERVIFDMKDVDYISSSFIRICVATAKQAGNGRFSMVNCQPFIKKTFRLSGLEEILNVS